MLSLAQFPVREAVAQNMAVAGGSLRIEALSKHYGKVKALDALSLSVGEGEVVSVTGPSGAGKSTLAKLISGLEVPTNGQIHLGGQPFDALPARARRVAHMFESFALYPTRSVAENIASPLNAPTSLGRWNAEEKRKRIDEVLELAEIAHLRDRLPSQLSGGQKQRVALCRALVQDPSVFVLDEPIGHLDAKLRHKLRGDIRRRQGRLRQGTLWLTPDGVEAMAVADRMVVLIDGVVQQMGAPDAVFARPANVRVARLIGDPAVNLLSASVRAGTSPCLSLGDGAEMPVSQGLLHRLAACGVEGQELLLGLRPAGMRLHDGSQSPHPGEQHFLATVYAVEPLGKNTIVSLDVGGQRVRAKVSPDAAWPPGSRVTVSCTADDVLLFSSSSGLLLP